MQQSQNCEHFAKTDDSLTATAVQNGITNGMLCSTAGNRFAYAKNICNICPTASI